MKKSLMAVSVAVAMMGSTAAMAGYEYQTKWGEHSESMAKPAQTMHKAEAPMRKDYWGFQTFYERGADGWQKVVAEETVPAPDIVDTAVAAGSFDTLVTAVKAAGLVDVLKGDGPFTVFAPSDAAFAKLPAGTLEALLADKEKLTQVLKYHVVPGRLDSGKVTAMSALPTVQGSKLPVDSIRIASTDIETSNGIIHVIDEVLIPAA